MTRQEKILQVALRVIAAVFCFGLYPLTILWPAGFMWEPRQSEYEQMILLMLAVMGIFLFLAARDPAKHRFFIWFTIWSSMAHGLLMGVQALLDPTERMNLIGDIPALLIVGVVLLVLTKLADTATPA
ncbi:hypothetical protein IQ266_12415 [filamentous cyanobacterium LEGE 11480]|uniref:Uncharacterized protein n=2 Tax=Romeriopsis TaxID=2992131 RepID=A0A928VQ37_9CYAN|nr:hypothetical protein [Romeriopsis navalis LEGE 11480]